MGIYKIIVAGSRDYENYEFVENKLDILLSNINREEIIFISGCCDVPGKCTFIRDDGTKVYGVDGLGERYAKECNIQIEYHPADWTTNGKAAGPIRNKEMANIATHCVVFYNGWSKGSKSMVQFAKEYKLQLREIKI